MKFASHSKPVKGLKIVACKPCEPKISQFKEQEKTRGDWREGHPLIEIEVIKKEST